MGEGEDDGLGRLGVEGMGWGRKGKGHGMVMFMYDSMKALVSLHGNVCWRYGCKQKHFYCSRLLF